MSALSLAHLKTFHLVPDDEIEREPQLSWLIGDLIPVGALAVLFGARESGKSFLALDVAFHVATGRAFHGRPVKRGAVVYVVAEGWPGFAARVAAWKKHYGERGRAGVYFIKAPVQLYKSDDPSLLVRTIRQAVADPVALVIFDTLSRCSVGGDENTAKDSGMLVASVATIQQELGAAVLMVHHTGWDTSRERGSTALGAACDTMVALTIQGSTLSARCAKQKDAPHFETLRFRLLPVSDSCVLQAEGASEPAGAISGKQRTCLEALAAVPGGLSDKGWREASGFPYNSFNRYKKALLAADLVRPEKKLYRMTEAGSAALDSHSQATPTGLP